MAYVLGGDFSHWNSPDFPALVAAEHKYAWLKATEHISFTDGKYWAHKAAAEAAGMITGPYHYFRAAWAGAPQAQHFFDNVGLDWKLFPAVDVERKNNGGFAQAVFKARLLECLERCEQLFGRKPVIYTSKYAWEELVGSAPWAPDYDLWVAYYSSASNAPLLPSDWTAWQAWQFTSTPLDTNRMKQEYWDSIVGPEPPPAIVKLTAPRNADIIEIALTG